LFADQRRGLENGEELGSKREKEARAKAKYVFLKDEGIGDRPASWKGERSWVEY